MLIQGISPVNYSGNQTFTAARSKNLEKIVAMSFDKLAVAKKQNSDVFLGSTKHGENIVIQESLLGKVAKLFVTYPDRTVGKGAKNFEVFNLTRENGKQSIVTDDNGIRPEAHVLAKVKMILEDLV